MLKALPCTCLAAHGGDDLDRKPGMARLQAGNHPDAQGRAEGNE